MTTPDTPRTQQFDAAQQRLQAEASIEQLEREFADTVDRQTIADLFADSLRSMSAARVTEYTPVFAERLARERLRALVSRRDTGGAPDAPPATTLPGVLFLCVHNAGRSQIAAGWLRALGGGRAEAYSAGSEPASSLNPAVVEAMQEVGISLADEFPKPWTEEVLRAVQVVVTMGCGDSCPIYPGVRYVDWEIEDPAGQDITAARRVRDDIRQRVHGLLAEIGVEPVERR